jgi:SNF2 family DNA or RNA helicase
MLIDIHPGQRDLLTARAEEHEKWRLTEIPAIQFDRKMKKWVLPILANVESLRKSFKKHEFTSQAIDRIKAEIAAANVDLPFTGKWPGTPMSHQVKALDLAYWRDQFFFAHAMGTGKTYTVLTLSGNLYHHSGMQGLLVVCPNPLKKDVWEPQIEEWLGQLIPDQYDVYVIEPGKYESARKFVCEWTPNLKILIASIESMSNAGGESYKICQQFLERHKAAMVVDESSRIKNHKAKRTQNVIDLGGFAWRRWAMTGTKITNGMENLYSQFRYLDWKIIGHQSFFTFEKRYCQKGGFKGKQTIGYNNTGELLGLIKPYIHVVRKEDANDLPPKTYLVRRATATADQKRVYQELKDFLETAMGERELTVENHLDRMTRFQQIAGGFFPSLAGKDPKTNKNIWVCDPLKQNPKLDLLLDILEDTDEQVLIWARFTPEIEIIADALTKKYGADQVTTYYGGTVDRSASIAKFKAGARFMILNQGVGGMGLNLTEATLAVYYSNSFNYEDRAQSEDRCHRTGQSMPVTYIDILINLPIDRDIQNSLLQKKDMAEYVADALA